MQSEYMMLPLQESSSLGKRKFTKELQGCNKRARQLIIMSIDFPLQDCLSVLLEKTLDGLSTCSEAGSYSTRNISIEDWNIALNLLWNMSLESEGESNMTSSQVRSVSPAPSEFSKTKSDDVLICQLFQRLPGQALDEAFLLQVMAQAFTDDIENWTNQILCPSSRSTFLEQMCKYKITESKKKKSKNILFWMLRCLDHHAGAGADTGSTKSFDDVFGQSIGRVLSHPHRQKDTFRRNPNLLHSLRVSCVYLQYLFRFISLRRNTCLLLLFVSCVEGRGVYHGRTSACMSVPHMCYRYMIETLGGMKLSTISPANRLPYQQIFFDQFEAAPRASTVA